MHRNLLNKYLLQNEYIQKKKGCNKIYISLQPLLLYQIGKIEMLFFEIHNKEI